MRPFHYIFIFLTTIQIQAQNAVQTDTIYANSKVNTALVFPDNVIKGITGNTDFIFSYDKKGGSRLGLLKVVSSGTTNLIVQTLDGNLYNFVLEHSPSIQRMTYLISADQRFVQLNPEEGNKEINQDGEKISDTQKKNTSEKKYDEFRKISEKLLTGPSRHLRTKRRYGIVMNLKGIHYHKDNAYITTEIQNHSQVDYDIDSLEFILVHGNRSRNSSFQQDILKKKFVYGMPNRIGVGEKKRIITVLPKFTLGKLHRLAIRLTEKNGTRAILLKNVK